MRGTNSLSEEVEHLAVSQVNSKHKVRKADGFLIGIDANFAIKLAMANVKDAISLCIVPASAARQTAIITCGRRRDFAIFLPAAAGR